MKPLKHLLLLSIIACLIAAFSCKTTKKTVVTKQKNDSVKIVVVQPKDTIKPIKKHADYTVWYFSDSVFHKIAKQLPDSTTKKIVALKGSQLYEDSYNAVINKLSEQEKKMYLPVIEKNQKIIVPNPVVTEKINNLKKAIEKGESFSEGIYLFKYKKINQIHPIIAKIFKYYIIYYVISDNKSELGAINIKNGAENSPCFFLNYAYQSVKNEVTVTLDELFFAGIYLFEAFAGTQKNIQITEIQKVDYKGYNYKIFYKANEEIKFIYAEFSHDRFNSIGISDGNYISSFNF